jgi:DNA-3-methyladenine glycosylase II
MALTLLPQAPFNLAGTVEFLSYPGTDRVDRLQNSQYVRALHFNKQLHLLTVEDTGTLSNPQLIINLKGKEPSTSAENLKKALSLVQHIFSTDHNLKGFRKQIKNDPVLSNLEKMNRGLQLVRWPTLFETITISILLQQISTLVALKLKQRLVEAYGERLKFSKEEYLAFPSPEVLAQIDVESLRELGISTAKAKTIIKLAEHLLAGKFNEEELIKEDNETIVSCLTRLRGIGRWTAEWALIRFFGRTNIFPAGDLALRAFITKFYNKGITVDERRARAIAEDLWGEWASYAVIYFFAGLRSGTINLRL